MGIQFFVIPIGIFILVLPFLRKDHSFLIWSIPLFVTSFLITAGLFERPGIEFVFGLGGFSLIVPTVFLVTNTIIQKISNTKNQTRNGMFFLFTIIILLKSFFVDVLDFELTQFDLMPPSEARSIFFHMSSIQAFFGGLVAGKMGEGTIGGGLKHSVILLIIGYLAFKFIV